MSTKTSISHSMKKIHFFLLIPLALLGLAISIHLTRIHYALVSGESLGFPFCQSGCDTVNGSRFSEFRGIPLSSYGAILYSLLLFLAFFGLWFRKGYGELSLSLTVLLSLVAVAVDGLLLYISLVRLKAFCSLCGLTYLINLNCLLVSLWGLLKSPRQALSIVGREMSRAFFSEGSLEQSPASYYQRIASFLFWVLLVVVGGSGWTLSYLYDSKHVAPISKPEKLKEFLRQYETLTRTTINLSRSPSRGREEAPLTIVDFSDFKCPHCKYVANLLTLLMREYRGQIRLVFKQFPNDSACNPNMPPDRPSSGSCLLAKAALCAHRQDRFWDYHDALFKGQGKSHLRDEENLALLAQQLGLARDDFSACLQNPNTETLLRSEIDEGLGLGVEGTPTLFFNGKMVRGTPPLDVLRLLIEGEVGKGGQGLEDPLLK